MNMRDPELKQQYAALDRYDPDYSKKLRALFAEDHRRHPFTPLLPRQGRTAPDARELSRAAS